MARAVCEKFELRTTNRFVNKIALAPRHTVAYLTTILFKQTRKPLCKFKSLFYNNFEEKSSLTITKYRTIFVHVDFETFLKPTSLTLITSGHVDDASSSFFALIFQVSTNRPFKKSSTTVATRNTVMFARSFITANSTQNFAFFKRPRRVR